MNKIFAVLLIAVCCILFSACNSERSETETTAVTATQPITNTITEAQKQETQTQSIEQTATTEETAALQMKDNESVQALKEFCSNQPLMIQMSRYGGFEQVGSIGTDLPQNDVSTTTSSGDIVLYSGNQMVVFYGSNTWAYTRLGHITDKTQAELTELLSNGNVTITLSH